MDERWLQEVVARLRKIGNDTQTYEVKEAKYELPKGMLDTVSAFSNGQGGFIILGLSEKNGFTPVDGFNARSMADALAVACGELSPVVRPQIEVVPFEGALVLCARVEELHPREKPCYKTSSGMYAGSFIRVGDGDRRLTTYEVERMLDEHHQPVYDDEAVEGATVEDFDPRLLAGFVARQRQQHPRLLGAKTDEEIMLMLHVIKRVGDDVRPTVGGLMAMGEFPQQFFPRLNVTFTSYPGIDKAARHDGVRFLDNKTIVGPIPMMVEETLSCVSENMKTGAVIEGAFRKDMPDYPPVAVREAVANALMHRDYSEAARGSQVQVNMYADRLEVLNPGGLYGDVTIEGLGTSGISSSRNQFLSNILETTPYGDGDFVVENRGTGYQEIEQQLKGAHMHPPIPRSSTVSFSLTFKKRRMEPEEKSVGRTGEIDEAILAYLAEHTSAATRELVEWSGLSKTAVGNHIRALVAEGKIEPLEPMRSPKQRYRLT